LRHVIFVIDAWFGNAVLGRADAFHPIGLPASFTTDGASFGIDPQVDPSFAEPISYAHGSTRIGRTCSPCVRAKLPVTRGSGHRLSPAGSG
jgi:hypothetical protein